MKKAIVTVLLTLSILNASTSPVYAATSTNQRIASATVYNRFYEVRMKDNKIQWIKECVRFKTKDGNFWTAYDSNHKYKKGMKVKLTFNTKGTKTKKDDEILKIRVDK